MELLKRIRSEIRVRRAVRKIESESLEDKTLVVFSKAFSEDKEGNLMSQQHNAIENKRKALRKSIFETHSDWRTNAPIARKIIGLIRS